jgi:PAS domain S-box-containing protein
MESISNTKINASFKLKKTIENPPPLDEYKVFLELSKLLENSIEPYQQFPDIMEFLNKYIDFDRALLYIYDTDNNIFKNEKEFGMKKNRKEDINLHVDKTIEWVCQNLNPAVWQNKVTMEKTKLPNFDTGVNTYIMIPLVLRNKCWALIRLDRKSNKTFDKNEIKILTSIAQYYVIFIENFQLQYQNSKHEKKFQRLIERINIPLFYCTAEGNLSCVNQSFLDLMGFKSYTDALKCNFFDYVSLCPAKTGTIKKLMSKGSYLKNLEVQLKRVEGQSIIVSFNINPVRDQYKKIIGYEGMIQNISEEKELEAQLHQAQKLGALGSLAGGIAHDFNNLIGGIMGCASLILTDIQTDNPYYNDVKTIMNASKKAADLATQLLSFSRDGKPKRKTISIKEVVSEVLNLLSRTIKKSIQIKTIFVNEIAPVEANSTRIQQALMNLCINARDAMPQGGKLIVKISNITLSKNDLLNDNRNHPGLFVLIQISDTGIGMNAKIMKKIFEPFFTTKRKDRGNGLGLAIASQIIKNHGGFIRVKSKKSEGSTFEIYLPACLNNNEPVKK